MLVQLLTASPTLANGLPLTNTERLPPAMLGECGLQNGDPGTKCELTGSPFLAAGLPSINTVGLPEAILYGLQCGTPASPCLAAAGIFDLHKS